MNHLSQPARTVQVVFICSSKQDPPLLSCRAKLQYRTQDDYTLTVIKTIKCNFPSLSTPHNLTFAQHFSTISLHFRKQLNNREVVCNLLVSCAVRWCVVSQTSDCQEEGRGHIPPHSSSGQSEPSGASQVSSLALKQIIFTSFYTLTTSPCGMSQVIRFQGHLIV